MESLPCDSLGLPWEPLPWTATREASEARCRDLPLAGSPAGPDLSVATRPSGASGGVAERLRESGVRGGVRGGVRMMRSEPRGEPPERRLALMASSSASAAWAPELPAASLASLAPPWLRPALKGSERGDNWMPAFSPSRSESVGRGAPAEVGPEPRAETGGEFLAPGEAGGEPRGARTTRWKSSSCARRSCARRSSSSLMELPLLRRRGEQRSCTTLRSDCGGDSGDCAPATIAAPPDPAAPGDGEPPPPLRGEDIASVPARSCAGPQSDRRPDNSASNSSQRISLSACCRAIASRSRSQLTA